MSFTVRKGAISFEQGRQQVKAPPNRRARPASYVKSIEKMQRPSYKAEHLPALIKKSVQKKR